MSRRRTAACAALLTLLLVPAARASDWVSELFPDKYQPKSIHYRARVVDRSAKVHFVEAWREPRRLRRTSDGILDLYANRTGTGLATVLFDKRSGHVLRGDERALLRTGHVEAWSELAYVLVRPAGTFDLGRAGPPKRRCGTTCQPYRLVRTDGTAFTFCWSSRLRLPLEINTAAGQPAFVVDFVEERPAPAGIFLPPAPSVTDQTDDD